MLHLILNKNFFVVHHKKKFLHKWEESTGFNCRSPQKSPRSSVTIATSLHMQTDTNGMDSSGNYGNDLRPVPKEPDPVPSGNETESKPALEEQDLVPSGLKPVPPGLDPIPSGPKPVPEPVTKREDTPPSSPLFDDFSDDDGFDEEGEGSAGGGVVKSLRNLAEESYAGGRGLKKEPDDDDTEQLLKTKGEKKSRSVTPLPSPSLSPSPSPPPPQLQSDSLPVSFPGQDVAVATALHPESKKEEEMDVSFTPPSLTVSQEEEPCPQAEQDCLMEVDESKQAEESEEREEEREDLQTHDKEDKREMMKTLLKPPPPSKRKMSLLEYRNRSKKPVEPVKRVSYEKPSPLPSSLVGVVSSSHSGSTVGSVSSPISRSLLSFSCSFLSDPSTSQRQTPLNLGIVLSFLLLPLPPSLLSSLSPSLSLLYDLSLSLSLYVFILFLHSFVGSPQAFSSSTTGINTSTTPPPPPPPPPPPSSDLSHFEPLSPDEDELISASSEDNNSMYN